jgi:TetR/AcrR family transcriptional repressor of nem operon
MALAGRAQASDTRTAVLDIAERLVQNRGFNGFSYADVASELGITKAALHYHFRGKAELGEALITRYAARFAAALVTIDAIETTELGKLAAYTDVYLGVLRQQRMCLCGMLAAEYLTLPDPIRRAVVTFFDDNLTWLSELLERGRSDGSVRFDGPTEDAAQMIVGALEGAMLVARPYGSTDRFEAVARRLVAEFSAEPSSQPSDAGSLPRT